MRKDLRVGLGIGGVMLAVLVVALVVRSHTKHKDQESTKIAATDKPDNTTPDATPTTPTTPTPSDTPIASGAPDSTPTPSPTPATATPPAPDSAAPDDPFRGNASTAETKGTDWDKLLADGMTGTPSRTLTPTANHGTERAIGEHFAPSTPGSFPAGAGISTGAAPPIHGAAATGTPRTAHTHTVAEGETLSSISRTVYGSKKYYLLIEKANPSIVANRLRPGTVINIPELSASDRADHHATSSTHGGSASVATAAKDSATEYVIKSGDSLYRISMKLYGTPNKVDAIYDANQDRIGPDRQRLKLGVVLKLPSPPTSNGR